MAESFRDKSDATPGKTVKKGLGLRVERGREGGRLGVEEGNGEGE